MRLSKTTRSVPGLCPVPLTGVSSSTNITPSCYGTFTGSLSLKTGHLASSSWAFPELQPFRDLALPRVRSSACDGGCAPDPQARCAPGSGGHSPCCLHRYAPKYPTVFRAAVTGPVLNIWGAVCTCARIHNHRLCVCWGSSLN